MGIRNLELLTIADKTFSSRLIVGTGKYSSPAVMVRAHEASGAEMITVAVRRVNISDRSKESLLDYIDTAKYVLLPNTAGCYTADAAVRTARPGRADGVLMNTAIAGARDPVAMAESMKLAVRAGRLAYRAGRIPRKLYASASSPIEGLVGR